MTNLEELLAAIENLKVTLLDAIMAADASEAMERWLEMEVELEPEVRTVEIGGLRFRAVQTHPFKPEGGGGGILYPLGNGGSGTVRLYGNDEVIVEVERK